MDTDYNEEKLLRSVALQNANAVLLARERAEQELLKAKESLQQTTDRLTNILESITDGFISCDSDWRIVFVNRRAEELLRPLYKSKENLLGLSYWEAFPDTVGTPLEEKYRRALLEQVPLEFENFYPPLRAWFDIRVYPSPHGISIFFHDITARKNAQEALRQQHEWFAVTLASIGDAVITTDTEGKVTFLNPVAEAMTGWTTVEALGNPLDLVFHLINERTRQSCPNPVQKVLEEGKVVGLANHTVLLTRDGREIAIEDSAAPIRDSQGRLAGAVMVFHDVTERRRAETALRQSEGRFAALVQATAQIVWVTDSTGSFVEFSASWHAFTGQTLDEMKGWGRLDVIHHDDRALLQAAWQQALDSKTALTLDYRVRHVSGDWRWTTMRAAPILADNGSIQSWVGMNTDITDRKKSEEALRRSEEELRALADSIPQLAWMATADGNIFWYNRRWYEYTGTTLEQMQGWGWQAIHDPKMLPSVLEAWKQSLATGQPFDMEFPLRGGDGTFRWFLTRVNPVHDLEGRVIRWFGTNTDVEDVRRIQESLRDETRILELLNHTGTAVASKLDLQNLVQTVTDAATKLCGARFGAFFYNVINDEGESLLLYTLSGAPREAFEKFGMPRNTPIFNPTFTGQAVMRSGDITKDPRYGTLAPHHGMPRGHLPVCSFLSVPVISRNREVIGGLFFGHPEPNVFTERAERLVVGIAAQAAIAIDNARLFEATQQSERKLAEANADLDKKVQERTASLQQAISQMEEFSYSVSHDLRAPVRAIQAYARFIQLDFADQLPPGANDFLNKIALNTDRMNRLINDVLSLSKIARSEMRLRPISVRSLVEEIIEQHPAMQPPQARIELTVAVKVIGDEISLFQALSNLLTNAVKFVPLGVTPKVKIWSESSDGKAKIWVEDNGMGIKPEHQPKLFGMFQRLQKNPLYDGTGVGLAIVKKAVERMGGSVGVESDGVSGSRFWIELNLAPI